MGHFLAAHGFGNAANIVPAAGFLEELTAFSQDSDLPGNLILQGRAGAAEAVHVFDFDFLAQLGFAFETNAHVDIAADHAFFHVGIADAAIDKDFFEGVEIGVGHFGAGDVGLGDDLQQGHAGTVKIKPAAAIKMKALADVFFQVSAGNPDATHAAVELEIDIAVRGGGLVVLSQLVVLGHVGVKIILPIELGVAGDFAIEQVAGQNGEAQGFFVGDGQDAGHAQADRADVGIGGGAILIGAAAPHLRFGL